MGEVVSGPGFRACSHSGCAWPASATLSFEYESRRTWLEDLIFAIHPASYDLCSVHAGRFRPPRGWSHDDRRRLPEPVLKLAAEPERESEPAPTAGAVRLPAPEKIALPEI